MNTECFRMHPGDGRDKQARKEAKAVRWMSNRHMHAEEMKISIMYAAARHSWTQSAGQFTILIVSTGIKEWTGHLCLWQKNGISHSIFADHYRSSLRSSAVRNLFRVGLCRGDTVSAGSKILLRKRMVFRQPGQGRL